MPNSCTSNVSIPAGTPNTPIISTTDIQVGNVTIGNGVSVTLQGAYKLMVCGNWASGTSASVVGGITEFNGSTAQIITGVTQFEVLKLNNSAGATITGAGTVSVYSQYVPKLGPLSIASTSKFKFLSTSASHCATIDMSAANTGIIVGNIQAQRFIPVSGSNQHYISAPVNAIQVSQIGVSGTPGFVVPTPTCDETILAAGSPYGKLFTYDESNGTSCALACWKVITGGTTVNAKGYSAYLTGTTSTPLTLKGKANMSASYSVAGLTNSNWTNSSLQGNSYRSGWALVGNPYLSNLNLAGTHTGFDAQAQVWVTSGLYAGTYQPVMMGSGSAYIAPFQGFMVHKTTTGGTATFTVNRSECTNTSTSFYKTYMSNEGTLTMKLNGNGFNGIYSNV